MCGCQMASPSAMQPVPMTKRICCGRSSVRNGTAKPAMKFPITECAVSNAALHKGNGLLLEWTPHLRYAMGS